VESVPEDTENGGCVPTPEEEAHVGWGVRARFPEDGGVKKEEGCACDEKNCDDAVFEKVRDQKNFYEQECGDEKFSGDPADFCCEGGAAGLMVRLDVHDFAKDVRVHGEERAEEKCLPGKLRDAIEPTAEDEDE